MRFSFFICVIAFTSCHVDYKNSPGISKDISDSKARNVFIDEYVIDSASSDSAFEFTSIWVEKNWNHQLDDSGNEFAHINENSAPKICFLMNDSMKFNKSNYLNWIISFNDRKYVGQWDGGLGGSFTNLEIPDSLELTLYYLKKSNFVNDTSTCMGKVFLHRKNLQSH